MRPSCKNWGFLRLLTNRHVMAEDVKSFRDAWRIYDALLADPRVAYHIEPDGMEAPFRKLTDICQASPNLLTDAYLAAFARALQLRATLDTAFRAFQNVESLVLC